MKITTQMLTRSALLLALAIAVQSVKMPTFVTGPLVNAVLFLAVSLVGPLSGVLIGLLTPGLAYAFGIMPFWPVVPLIMLANALLSLAYGFFTGKPYLGIVAASVIKYAALAGGVYYILPGLLQIKIPEKLVLALSTQQLFTALAGGVIALVVLKSLQVIKPGFNKLKN